MSKAEIKYACNSYNYLKFIPTFQSATEYKGIKAVTAVYVLLTIFLV